MDKYSILLVDDHKIVLEGTKGLLSQLDLYNVKAVAATGKQALAQLTAHDFDILVTDYQLPDLTGLELVKAAKAAQPEIKVIVLSMHDDPAIVKELLAEGVNGYVLKNDTADQLLRALDKVTDGKRFLSDEMSDLLIRQVSQPQQKSTLTPREKEIVKLIVKEYSSKEIAAILFISEKTVETHRKNILRKTKAGNIVGLIKYAYQHNIVTPHNT